MRRAEERPARAMQRAWRCAGSQGARDARTPGAMSALAAGFWRVVEPRLAGGCEGCPFEGVYHPPYDWTREVFDAMALTATGDGGTALPWAVALGREITAADREAILSVQRARSTVLRAEMAQREAEKPR